MSLVLNLISLPNGFVCLEQILRLFLPVILSYNEKLHFTSNSAASREIKTKMLRREQDAIILTSNATKKKKH